ncbi:MAG: transcriptional regulator GcvA [Sneathiellales bacterium]|nr:transcriptional regulator GcvA [Sneathiellales bacterium]
MRLPPLNALRSFEAAARHLSFSKAADELAVTPAAVSHQIKALEEWLGVPLFKRLNRAVILTDEGQSYVVDVREGFDLIDGATKKLIKQDLAGALTVSTLPSFATSWLLPRLPRFRDEHPDIDIMLSANENITDFAKDPVDLVIRYGSGNYPGLYVENLMEEDRLFPVCSPALLEGEHPLRTPQDLIHHNLLHDDLRVDWESWLEAAGVKGINPTKGLKLNDSSMVLMAAIAGHGVALGRSTLAADLLETGQLVRPFEKELNAGNAYYIVCPFEQVGRPRFSAFREWLLKEAQMKPGSFGSAPSAD